MRKHGGSSVSGVLVIGAALVAAGAVSACRSPDSSLADSGACSGGCAGHHHRIAIGATSSVSEVMTADIQAGIERHIAGVKQKNDGFFPVEFEGKPLRLKLVRVHTEYLANLGPGRHFACVDLANIDGNVYDVDFFLEGDAAAMTVTETLVHKLNGQPYYVWQQNDDDTWERVPFDGAGEALLGVRREPDSFEFIYEATLPKLDADARMWLPIPDTDEFQTVEVKEIAAPGERAMLTDQLGNRVMTLALTPADSGKTVSMRFGVRRVEKPPYAGDARAAAASLGAEKLVPDAPLFRELATGVTAGKEGELARARAIFDHTIDEFRYQKYGVGWGKGDALRACDAKSGNCTDFHAYFIALCRAAGLPARFAIGASIPSERDSGGIDGYHCWAEFFAEGKWWPVDLSEADKHGPLSSYYFGRHPANRIELSRGRDLVLNPAPASGPINFLAYPLLEVGGKPVSVPTKFSFRRG